MIYMHVPYCRQICFYCDFYRTKNQKTINDFVEAICQEIRMRTEFAKNLPPINTLYWGGGTPSLLDRESFAKIMSVLNECFDLSNLQEHTLEADPETFNEEKVLIWKQYGVNRISLGVQSFVDRTLKQIGRTHSEESIFYAYDLLISHSLANINIDLLICTPQQSFKELQYSMHQIERLKPKHLSVYSLNIEEKSIWGKMLKKKDPDFSILSEEQDLFFSSYVSQSLKAMGYSRYEISNYAQSQCFESKHNWGYWTRKAYMGFGPSAHSFDGFRRRSKNKSSIGQYCSDLRKNALPVDDTEDISEEQKGLEQLLSKLRTRKGVSIDGIDSEVLKTLEEEKLVCVEKNIVLTDKGCDLYNEVLKMFL